MHGAIGERHAQLTLQQELYPRDRKENPVTKRIGKEALIG
jgi:hypothetical protein